jgi:hypothetical protein
MTISFGIMGAWARRVTTDWINQQLIHKLVFYLISLHIRSRSSSSHSLALVVVPNLNLHLTLDLHRLEALWVTCQPQCPSFPTGPS